MAYSHKRSSQGGGAVRKLQFVGRYILVDGYNIIKNSPSLQAVEAKNFAAARQALITLLASRFRHTPHQVVVVFDGDAATEQVSQHQRVRIIYSRHKETADSVIARLASEAQREGRDVEMYSNDGEVQRAVSQQGGGAHSVHQLIDRLNAPSSDVERRHRHRQAVRREYGLDGKKDADESYYPTKPGKKKSSRHRK